LASLRDYLGIEASDFPNPERVASRNRYAGTYEVRPTSLDFRISVFGPSDLRK